MRISKYQTSAILRSNYLIMIFEEKKLFHLVQDTSDCPGLPIMSRDTWGAATPEQIDNLTLPVRMFFIHHTDTKGCNSMESCSQLMRSIQRFHMKDRGPYLQHLVLYGHSGEARLFVRIILFLRKKTCSDVVYLVFNKHANNLMHFI